MCIISSMSSLPYITISSDLFFLDFSEVVLEDITDTDLDSSCDNCDRVIPPAEPASIDLSCSSCSNYSSKNRKHKKWYGIILCYKMNFICRNLSLLRF